MMMNTIIDKVLRFAEGMKVSVQRMRAAGLLAGIFAFVWWCLLYPELCFPQDTYETVYEADKEGVTEESTEKEDAEQEKPVSAEENCRRLLQADKEQVIVKSRLLEWLEQHIE